MVPEGMACWALGMDRPGQLGPFLGSGSGFLDELDPEEAKLSLEADQQSSQIPLT